MKREFLELTPIQCFCPFCNRWHDVNCPGFSFRYTWWMLELECPDTGRQYQVYCDGKDFKYKMNLRYEWEKIAISDVGQSDDDCTIFFNTSDGCLAFKFKESEYNEIVNATKHAEKKKQQEQDIDSKKQVSQQPQVKENKEDTAMPETTKTAKKTCITTLLYEKSPKENLETLKIWAEKYKPTLKWLVPVGAVYTAYRILNSDKSNFSVKNIASTCEKELGFKLEFLENKKALKQLMVIGGTAAGAYGAVKAASSIFGSKEENEDIYIEDVEAGMTQLNSISKKFSWIQPKTEEMFPVAVSVILVYLTLHKPTSEGKVGKKIRNITEDWQIKLGTYADMAKLFIQDKFKIDLNTVEDKKNMRICGFLVAVIGVLVFLYGKEVLENRDISKKPKAEINKDVNQFVEQAKVVIKKIAPTMYTTLITMLVSKKILSSKEALDIDEEEDVSKSEVYEGEFHEVDDISESEVCEGEVE